MGQALSNSPQTQKRAEPIAGRALDWRRRASDHVAYGLLIYTGMHIFVTLTALKSGGGSILPYMALVVLVAAIVPACWWIEKRWNGLSDAEAADPSFAPRFRREMFLLWLCALGLPIVLTFAFKAILSIF